MTPRHLLLLAASASLVLAAGCSSTKSAAPAPAPGAAPAAAAKPAEKKPEGEIVGRAAPGSKFSRLSLGMTMDKVQDAMGRAPDKFDTYESGKRWIPFYFGSDARRLEALYRGEGCLVFTGGNVWGGGGGDLIKIEHDASGNCYKNTK